MKLVMEVFTGRLFYVDVEEGTTVADLKAKIGVQENFPKCRLILMLDTGEERTLLNNDAAPLGDSGIQDSSHIYIFFGVIPHNADGGDGGSSHSHNTHSAPMSPKEAYSSPKEAPPPTSNEVPLLTKEAPLSPKRVVSGESSTPKDV